MAVTKNLTEGNIYKNFLAFALPLIVSSLLSTAYSTVDAMIAGKFISEHALGAISATGSFDTLFQSLFTGFGIGFSVYAAHLFGMKEYAALKRDTVHVLMIIAAVCVPLSALSILFRDPIMDYLQVDPILRGDAEIYFIIHTLAYAFSFCNLLLLNVLQSLGATLFSVYVPMGSAVLNISGNLLTVLVFDMGVAGLALSTVVSIIAATVFYVIILRRAFRELPTEKVSYRFSFSGFCRSLRYTFPAAVQQLAFHGVGFLIAPSINGLGAAATTGFNISNRMYSLATIPLWSMTSAFSCYTAQCVGAGSYGKIRRGLRVGLLMNCAAMLPFVAVSMLFARPITALFFPAGFTGEAYGYAVRYATVFIPFLFVQLIGHLLHSYMRSLGKVSVVLGITLFGSIVRIAATLLLVPQLRMDGVFLGQIISWAADGLLSCVLFRFLYRTEEHIRRAVHTVHSGK